MNLDNNTLIALVEHPNSPAAQSARAQIGDRTPLVSPYVRDEFLVKGNPAALAEFMARTHSEFGPHSNNFGVSLLADRGLDDVDALVVQSGVQRGARTLTRDNTIIKRVPELSEVY